MTTAFSGERPLLTVMLQCKTPETAIGRIRNALQNGAEAFGLQMEDLLPEYQTADVFLRIKKETCGLPLYVTNYRGRNNAGKTDDELAEELLALAENGAALCDVMGDFFDKDPHQLTMNPAAVNKQENLIESLHEKGAGVLMSTHDLRFIPRDEIMEIAREQKRRGADVIKIVSAAETMEQQLENLRTTEYLKRELGAPFLFLSSGECKLHRRLGIILGCCMCLCVYEHDALSTPQQPLLSEMRILRNNVNL